MKVTVREENNWKIIDLDGKLNEVSSQTLVQEIDTQLNNDNNKIILNLEKLNFINSSGLGSLISIVKRVSQNNGKLCLTNLQVFISDLFEITKLTNIFDIKDTVEDALKS